MENSESGIRTEGWDWVGAFRSCHCYEEQDVSFYVFPVPSVLQDSGEGGLCPLSG